MITAAIYARKSTEQHGIVDEQKSVTRQVDHARAYAQRKGWTLDPNAVFVDDGISGAEFAGRPGFVRLMNALKPRPAFQVLIMSEESRLGREAIETAYALKQLVTAGVRVFFYMEDRERTLDSPTDKIMLSLTAFADELEREKARQRTYDAMLRKARAGHVTGGQPFGYENVEVLDAIGRRSHVERRVNNAEAEIVRRVFTLSANGHGIKAIAKLLNAEGTPSPRAQCGRSQSWAPSSVRDVLHRESYRGIIAWNRTRKRNVWGQRKQSTRPNVEWLTIKAPALRIVSDDLWRRTHARLATVRRVYLESTDGQAFGRPALGDPSKYLLTNMLLCGRCGGPMKVRTRGHGSGSDRERRHFYGCSHHHERGICANGADVPMELADLEVSEALLDTFDQSVISDAVDETLVALRGCSPGDRLGAIEAELRKVEQERQRFINAIATGGQLAGLLAALQAREQRLTELEAARERARTTRRFGASDLTRMRRELIARANDWRAILAENEPQQARPIIGSLLEGRVTITPKRKREWQLTGMGTLAGLFEAEIAFPEGSRPQPASHPRETPGIAFSRLFRAA